MYFSTRKLILFSIAAVILIAFLLLHAFLKRQEIRKITEIERLVNYMPMADTNRAIELVREYAFFFNRYPLDTLAPDYQFRAMNVLLNLEKTDEAMYLLKDIQRRYPSSPEAPVCFFMEGYVQENYLLNLDRADSLYREFLVKYPEHYMYRDVLNSLDFLQALIQQKIKEFEYRYARDSVIYLEPDSVVYFSTDFK
jgi:hypothetical protein